MNAMKPIAVALFLLVLPIISFAQTLNGEFEEWIEKGSGESPTGWSTSSFGSGKNQGAYSGYYAASVWNWYSEALGYMITGESQHLEWDLKYTGIPIDFIPTKLTGYYKYELGQIFPREGHGEDSAAVIVLLKRYNEELNDIDTISFGTYLLPATNEWIPFSIDIPLWLTNIQPDSIVVAFYSSNPNNVAFCGPDSSTCCYLSVDKIALTTTSGVPHNIDRFLSLARVIPNPVLDAGAVLRFDAVQGGNYYISIRDASGRLAAQQNVSSGEVDISSLQLPSGAYYLTIVDDANAPVAFSRFVVE